MKMVLYSSCWLLLLLYLGCVISHRAGPPPGINPNMYNKPHMHQVPPHPSVNQGIPKPHGGHDGGPQKSVLSAANMEHEKEHLGEHLNVPTLDTSQMSPEELQFHYFKMHDSDNNNRLDGSELIKSLIHWHEQGREHPGDNVPQPKIFTDEELENLIDPILKVDDTDNDGYISWHEFKLAQARADKAP